MTFTTLADVLVGIALVAWLCVRQLRWTAVQPARLWRLPVVLGAIGVLDLVRAGGTALSATDLALLLVEVAVALGTGAAMGRIAVFRPIPAGAAAARQGEPAPTVQSRTGWMGVALWVVLLAARVGIGLVGHQLGAVALTSTGVILLTVALNRAARGGVLQARLGSASLSFARR